MSLALDTRGQPDPAACKASGYDIVCQYISGDPMTPPKYVAAVTQIGLGLVSIWEIAADAANLGATQGHMDGANAVLAAEALNQPTGTAIYTTVDFDASPTQIADNVVPYISAFAAEVRRAGYTAGCYGDPNVLDAVHLAVDFTWESAGWTGGVSLGWVNMRQELTQTTVAGVLCDVDEVLTEFVGAWNLNGPYPRGDTNDMAVTNDWLIRTTYRQVLHREVDPGGYTTWFEFLAGGGDPGEMWAKVQDSAEGVAVLAAERKAIGLS